MMQMSFADGMYFRKRYPGLLLVVVLVGQGACASTQGTIGPTSTGAVNISIQKTSAVSISGLNDMLVTWPQVSSDIVWTNDVCVYSTNLSGGYRIGVDGVGNKLEMADGAKRLPYSIAWNDGGAGNLSNNGIAIAPGAAAASLSHAATQNALCNSSVSAPNARLIINIPSTAMQATGAGNYASSVTLIVAAN